LSTNNEVGMAITTIKTGELRSDLAQYMRTVRKNGEILVITLYGEECVAIVPYEHFKRLFLGKEKEKK
jgi:prevent-host-death family protein